MDLGLAQGHDLNIRKQEGTSTKSAYPRKLGDDVFSSDRPGSLYVVPSKYQTAAQFHEQHVSYYKKRKRDRDAAETKPRKQRSDKGTTKKEGARAAETKPRKQRSDKGTKRKKKTCTLPTQRITNWFN